MSKWLATLVCSEHDMSTHHPHMIGSSIASSFIIQPTSCLLHIESEAHPVRKVVITINMSHTNTSSPCNEKVTSIMKIVVHTQNAQCIYSLQIMCHFWQDIISGYETALHHHAVKLSKTTYQIIQCQNCYKMKTVCLTNLCAK